MGRTAKYHYSLGKKCIKCGEPIVNSNKGNYCFHCADHILRAKPKTTVVKLFQGAPPLHNLRQSNIRHKKLIKKAVEYLYSLGYENIQTEYEYKPKHGQRYIIDAVAISDGIIAIECGDLRFSKVINLAPKIKELMVWPYKYRKPVRIDIRNSSTVVIAPDFPKIPLSA